MNLCACAQRMPHPVPHPPMLQFISARAQAIYYRISVYREQFSEIMLYPYLQPNIAGTSGF